MNATEPNFTTEQKICRGCNETFAASMAATVIFDQPFRLVQNYCEGCVANFDRDVAQMSDGRAMKTRKPWSEICPPAYFGFDPVALPEAGARVMAEVFEWRESQRGVGLIGPSRAGKTFILHELMRRWYEQGRSVHMPTATSFAYACGSPEQSERRTMIDRCIGVDLLFIDDLGKMKITDRVESDFYQVLEERRRAKRPVFATVNSTGDELRKKMSDDGGEPIINRLKLDLCDFIAVK